jgi:glutamate/tyrosine decarboxylase-like PLP-dependent enzyme
LGLRASYISAADDVREQIDWTPEWTRRARGFPVYAALRELGRSGVAALVERCCACALQLTEQIGALPGAELVARPSLNQGLVRFLDPRHGAGDEDHDALTDQMIRAIDEEGTAFFSGTSWRGRRAMRISVVSWRSDEEEVRRTVAAVAKVLSAARP